MVETAPEEMHRAGLADEARPKHFHQPVGLQQGERAAWLERIVEEFHRKHRVEPERQEIKNQLRAVDDDSAALELLRRLQTTT